MKSSKFSGFFALLTAAIVYASFGLFIRNLDVMFGEYSQVFARTGLAAIIAFALTFLTKQSLKIAKERRLKVFIFAVAFPIAIIFFTFAVNQEKIANVVFLLYAGNIITSLLIGTLILKEKMNSFKLFSIILVFIGLIIFSAPLSDLSISTGLLFGFLSGVFEGITNYGRKDLKEIPRNTLLSYQYIAGFLITFILAILSGETIIKDVNLTSFITLLIFSFALVFLGNLLIYGFKHYDVNVGSIVLASEILFAAVIAFILLGESPNTNEVVGGVVIFIAASLSNIDVNWLKSRLKFL